MKYRKKKFNPKTDARAVARRFFSPIEIAALEPLADEPYHAAFLACWTRKEAYVKALGTQLGRAITRVTVSLPGDDPARIVAIDFG